MEITLKIQTTELSQDVIDKIRQFIFINGESNLVINISSKKKKNLPLESGEAYFARLDRSIDALENKTNLVDFSAAEFQAFAESKM